MATFATIFATDLLVQWQRCQKLLGSAAKIIYKNGSAANPERGR
ncbi:hypothetical protein [Rhizobium sp. BR 362]